MLIFLERKWKDPNCRASSTSEFSKIALGETASKIALVRLQGQENQHETASQYNTNGCTSEIFKSLSSFYQSIFYAKRLQWR